MSGKPQSSADYLPLRSRTWVSIPGTGVQVYLHGRRSTFFVLRCNGKWDLTPLQGIAYIRRKR